MAWQSDVPTGSRGSHARCRWRSQCSRTSACITSRATRTRAALGSSACTAIAPRSAAGCRTDPTRPVSSRGSRLETSRDGVRTPWDAGLVGSAMARDRDAGNAGGVLTETLLPGREVDRAGIGSEHHELRKRQPRAISNVGRGCERGWAIARKPEDERAEDMHAMIAECAQARDQCLANVVEALVHVLEAFPA